MTVLDLIACFLRCFSSNGIASDCQKRSYCEVSEILCDARDNAAYRMIRKPCDDGSLHWDDTKNV